MERMCSTDRGKSFIFELALSPLDDFFLKIKHHCLVCVVLLCPAYVVNKNSRNKDAFVRQKNIKSRRLPLEQKIHKRTKLETRFY